MKWKNIIRAGVIGVAIVATGFAASYIGLIPGVTTAVAKVISSVASAVIIGGYATTGGAAVAAAGKGIVNGFKYIFSKNYRNQVKTAAQERTRKREKKKAQRRDNAKKQNNVQKVKEKKPSLLTRAFNSVKNLVGKVFKRRNGQQNAQPELTETDPEIIDVDKELKKDSEKETEKNIEKEVEIVEEDKKETIEENDDKNIVKVESVDEAEDNDEKIVKVEPVEEESTDNDPVSVDEKENKKGETSVTVVNDVIDAEIVEKSKVEVKPSKKAGGLYDSLDENNQLIYDAISGKRFTSIFAKMSHDQFHEYLKILETDVERIKDKDPKKLTKTDVQTLALVDKMLRAKHHKVQVEGKKRYAPTKKASKGLTEKEIEAKSDELALDALIDRTDVTEEEIEKQRQKNHSGR